MHFAKLVCLLFGSTAFAATTVSTGRPATMPGARAAIPRVLKPATLPTKADIMNSIVNWQTSVNTINRYLNDPSNKTALTSAFIFAKDEPIQLATLMKTTSFSKTGVNAGKVLMGNFPSIVSNLNNVQTGAMSTDDPTAAVNFNRCCTVLPAIGALWAEAGTAMKIANASTPLPTMNLEEQCSQMSCSSGVVGMRQGMPPRRDRWVHRYRELWNRKVSLVI